MKKKRAQSAGTHQFLHVVMIAVLGILALHGKAAHGYSYGGHHWDIGNPTYVDFTVKSSIPYDWTAPIAAGASAWNGQSSRFRFRAGYADHNIARRSLDAGTLAQTYVRESWWTYRITDRDTDFNANVSFSPYGQAGRYDVQSVAAHEFGHWLMLDDLYGGGDYWKTMYGVGAPGQTYQRTLDADDINGIRAIYGT